MWISPGENTTQKFSFLAGMIKKLLTRASTHWDFKIDTGYVLVNVYKEKYEKFPIQIHQIYVL